MDSGWAALLGSLIGGLASLGGTGLAHWLAGAETRKLAQVRQETLKKRFAASNRTWVPMQNLMDCIGADRDTTVQHLLMIGARRSMVGNDSWGLKDWPEPSN
jgi:hypothetical protein